MAKIYNNQTLLTFNFDTGIDLTNIATAIIKHKDSSGVIGEWTGSIVSPATDGIVEYTTYDGSLDAGTYTVWVVLTDNQGLILPTESSKIRFYTESE